MSNNSNIDEEKIFEEFMPEDREAAREVWSMSEHADTQRPQVGGDEVEKALSKVHRKMDAARASSATWKWVAAAAIVLLMFGGGILLYPRTATAPRGQFASVPLPDGSTIDLNSGSSISYNGLYGLTNRSVSLDGEAFFSVQKGEQPFYVHAHGATVRVTGTKFNVRSWSGEPYTKASVAVAEGQVKFYPEGQRNRSVTIDPGQLSTWAEHADKPSVPKAIAVDRVTGWRDHKLIFDQKSLAVIFQELERRFDIKITLDASDMADETLTTYYTNPKNAESVLKDICRVKGLRFAKTANGYRVYK